MQGENLFLQKEVFPRETIGMLLYDKHEITSLCYDSRKAGAGCAFFCLTGFNSDGHDYARAAYDKGCRVFVAERALDLPDDAKVEIVPDSRAALGDAAAEFYGHADRELTLIGVTGTKGKTSVSTFIYQALNACGAKCGFIGTTGADFCGTHQKTLNSTPERIELHRLFREMADKGCRYCVMEVSSQAEKVGRVAGLEFGIAVFTNLSPDHIGPGEHESFEDYRDCKAKLFSHCLTAVVNCDDEYGGYMAKYAPKTVTYGRRDFADFRAGNVSLSHSADHIGAEYDCSVSRYERDGSIKTETFHVTGSVPGEFSVSNSLAALAVCETLGMDRATVLSVLSKAHAPGRFEAVKTPLPASFIIDYAHNELSLETALRTLKSYSPKRLICLFGCIGGRAQLRREAMGKAAAELCDYLILTSDNPDFERPLDIIVGIERGIIKADRHPPYVRFTDRADAIRYAADLAEEGDIVLLAGKGHEDYQIIEGKHVHFVEREILLDEAEKRAAGKPSFRIF